MKRLYVGQQWLFATSLLTLVTFPALAEDKTACSAKAESWERGHRHWGYRIVDGRRCWFVLKASEHRGEHRALELLFWDDTRVAPMIGAFERRWRNELPE
jgi:hypothetical protein